MQVMVLAAGFGERLKPLTDSLAKPALPLFDETVMGRLLKCLASLGADRIVYNTHHLADEVARAAEEACPPGVELLRSHEESIQGTAGALREASALFRDEPLVLLNADVIHDADLHRLVAYHRTHGSVVTLLCRADPQSISYGPLGLDGEGRVRRFLEWVSPEAEASRLKTVMFTGIQVIEPSAIEGIAEGFVSTTETLYPDILRRGEAVFGALHEGYWMDIGTPARYLKAHRDLLRGKMGKVPKSEWSPAGPRHVTIKEPVWVARDAVVESLSVLDSYAVVGPRCRLGPGVVLERSVLMAGVEVGPRAYLEGCIVAPEVHLGASGDLTDQLITLDEDGGPVFTPIGPGGEAA
jgi:NDP-sugar pyrophosphorylase family protein